MFEESQVLKLSNHSESSPKLSPILAEFIVLGRITRIVISEVITKVKIRYT